MTNNKIFYISYQFCNYMKNREKENQFEDYEFCMYVSDMANDIQYAIENNDYSVLKPYYAALEEELSSVCCRRGRDEVIKLLNLLNEC